ncbi:MAG TPA: FAD-dependent monooxygenase [Chthoniobacterales bacterium]|nr:FAD-dependent monooxygenase [Chthoniobacterales bacterium]
MDDDIEVLIAGAGPVGLALALELQRFGIRFRIVEKKAERSTTSKALGLQPRLSEVFAIQGIAEQFAARGFSDVRAVNARSGAKKLLTITVRPPANQAGREACQPRMFVIPQSVTEEILETTLQERGHAVERRREFAGLEQDAGGVNAVVRNDDGSQETIRAQFLVSCEGAHSLVRKQAGFSFTGTTMPLRFLLADVTIDWDLPSNEVQVWFHRDGVFGALPFGAQKWRLIVERAETPDEAAEEVTLALVQQLAIERTLKKDIRIRDPIWLSDFRINARMVDRFRDRRLFVAGDAAHIHSPLGGQGIATGIQDATNLAWKLAACLREGAPDALLDTYDEERKPIARTVLRGTSAASHLIFAMNPVLRFVRERLVFPILRTGIVQRRLIGNASQLEVTYRGRSLAAHFDQKLSRARVRAGDRVPDVLFKRGDEKVTLFRLIGTFGMLALFGPGQNVHRMNAALAALRIRSFIVSTQSAGTLPDQYLEDLYADFARLYGAQGPFLYLVRPDGHVALFQRQAEAGALAAYLKKIREAEAVEKAFAL